MDQGAENSCLNVLNIGFVLFVVFLGLPPLLRFVFRKKIVCLNCHYLGYSIQKKPGSFLLELFLWCCIFIPGIAYSLWRMTSKQNLCPVCKSPNIIPIDSFRGRELEAEINGKQKTTTNAMNSNIPLEQNFINSNKDLQVYDSPIVLSEEISESIPKTEDIANTNQNEYAPLHSHEVLISSGTEQNNQQNNWLKNVWEKEDLLALYSGLSKQQKVFVIIGALFIVFLVSNLFVKASHSFQSSNNSSKTESVNTSTSPSPKAVIVNTEIPLSSTPTANKELQSTEIKIPTGVLADCIRIEHSSGEPSFQLDDSILKTSSSYKLPPGKYSIVYQRQNYSDINQDINIENGRSITLQPPTEKEWENNKKAVIRMMSNIRCQVFLYQENNGQKLNTTAHTLEKDDKLILTVKPDFYKIKAVADGYGEWGPRPLGVNSGESKNIDICFEKALTKTNINRTNTEYLKVENEQIYNPESFMSCYYDFINNGKHQSAYLMESPKYRQKTSYNDWYTKIWQDVVSVEIEDKQVVFDNGKNSQVILRLRCLLKPYKDGEKAPDNGLIIDVEDESGMIHRQIYAIAFLSKIDGYWYLEDFKNISEEDYKSRYKLHFTD